MWKAAGIFIALLMLLPGLGCRTAYYGAWEKLGKHKRDLLRDNIQAAQREQVAASEQFEDALTRLKELYAFEGGNLERLYNRLNSDYNRSASRVEAVQNRISKVEQIAADLFREWENELGEITNPRLREQSRAQLQQTRQRFTTLSLAMRRAEQSMEPVLTQLRDQVLYLKHNLNAQAVAALRGEALDIEREIQQLIREIQRAIQEADAFIRALPA
jgi:hypothetical protein